MPASRPLIITITLVTPALLAVATPSIAQETQPRRPLAGLGFMSGCWRGDAGVDKSIEEQWTAADSDVMLAMTRYVDDNDARTRGWEFSRIVVDSAGIVLLPAPRGEQRGRFRLAASAPGDARFEDPAHDFPKRILYRRVDVRHLAVRIDAGENDREAQEWRLELVACPAPAR